MCKILRFESKSYFQHWLFYKCFWLCHNSKMCFSSSIHIFGVFHFIFFFWLLLVVVDISIWKKKNSDIWEWQNAWYLLDRTAFGYAILFDRIDVTVNWMTKVQIYAIRWQFAACISFYCTDENKYAKNLPKLTRNKKKPIHLNGIKLWLPKDFYDNSYHFFQWLLV